MKKAVYLVLISIIALLSQCQESTKDLQAQGDKPSPWLNHADSVEYLGINTCRGCHSDIYDSFIETGMGQSFDVAHRAKSALPTTKGLLTDSTGKFEYEIYFRGDSLYLKEYKEVDGYSMHLLEQKVDFIIGSGQHTNSHIIESNGYLHQMPFTYYTQDGRLDLPPGFEEGNNSRFSRLIGLECMSCHNAMPTGFVKGSENKFANVPHGIDCERCHGPGELHVRKIASGDITDTSKFADPTIVNPSKISAELQFEICQRCHLQGNAVLKPDKNFFDFKPGMRLSEVMDVYMSRPSSDNEQFIMAGHIQRFKMSACYLENPKSFVCTSCHDPHVSVKKTDPDRFNRQCRDCHGEADESACTASLSSRNAVADNCSSCHMPLKGSSDIPHVRVHDHYIRIPVQTEAEEANVRNGLYAVNNEKPSRLSRLKAYLQQFERFEAEPLLLDSARTHFKGKGVEFFMAKVHYHFLKDQFDSIVYLGSQYSNIMDSLAQESFDNRFAWTSYRMAIAWKTQNEDAVKTERFFQQAVNAAPYILDFRSAFAAFLLQERRLDEAKRQYKYCLEEYPQHLESLNGIGYIALLNKQLDEAETSLSRCLQLDPDHVLARINRVLVHLQSGNKTLAEVDIAYLETYHPEQPRLKALKDYLDTI